MERLILQAMAKDPGSRFPDVVVMGDVIRALLESSNSSAATLAEMEAIGSADDYSLPPDQATMAAMPAAVLPTEDDAAIFAPTEDSSPAEHLTAPTKTYSRRHFGADAEVSDVSGRPKTLVWIGALAVFALASVVAFIYVATGDKSEPAGPSTQVAQAPPPQKKSVQPKGSPPRESPQPKDQGAVPAPVKAAPKAVPPAKPKKGPPAAARENP